MATYEITAPDGSVFEVTAPDTATEDAVMRYAQAQFKGMKPKNERSIPDSIGRQIGLTARAAIGGLAGIPNAIADPLVGLANRVGANLPIPSQALERTMTRAGLPQPEGGSEEFAQAVSRGMVGPAGFGKALPQYADRMGMQVFAGGAGAGSADVAKQLGAGPVGQFAAGLAGGVAPAAGAVALQTGAKAAANAVPGLIEPITKEGQRRIAARALQNAASDKTKALDELQNAQEYVPGSKPTTGQASGDIGLGLMEKAVRTRNPADFAAREAEQDAARQAGLSKVFGTSTDVQLAEDARDQATKAMRDAAFANAKKVNTKPIINSANTIKGSGAGARQEVEKAMDWVKSRLDGETDPERIYAIRQDINDIIAGKMRDPEKASYQLAAGQLKAVKAVLDMQLEKAAPGFKDYLKTYAGMSREIDKAQLGQDITKASINPTTERLSPAQFTRQFEKRAEDIANAGPVASDALTRVTQDLRRSSTPMAAGRAPGSDTLQNLVANNALARAGVDSGGSMQNAVGRGMGLLYKPFGSEDKVQDIIKSAMLDPQVGAQLLSMSLAKNPKATEDLLRKLLAIQQGGLLGIGSSQ